MEQSDIEKIIKEMIIEKVEGQVEQIDSKTDLENYGINSMIFIQLIVLCEDKFGIEFEEKYLQMNVLNTVEKIAQLIKQKMK